jgi:hypothetical protein
MFVHLLVRKIQSLLLLALVSLAFLENFRLLVAALKRSLLL